MRVPFETLTPKATFGRVTLLKVSHDGRLANAVSQTLAERPDACVSPRVSS
jgi:hypothetical protein